MPFVTSKDFSVHSRCAAVTCLCTERTALLQFQRLELRVAKDWRRALPWRARLEVPRALPASGALSEFMCFPLLTRYSQDLDLTERCCKWQEQPSRFQ